jgi:hypothetical protein
MDGIPSLWDPKKDRIDKWLKADNTNYSTRESTRGRTSWKGQPLSTKNLMVVLMVAFGITGLGHFFSCTFAFLKTIIPIRKILFH